MPLALYSTHLLRCAFVQLRTPTNLDFVRPLSILRLCITVPAPESEVAVVAALCSSSPLLAAASFNLCCLESASFSEVFSYTACRQLSQMLFAVFFFHGSEYVLAVVIHGVSHVTLKSLLISKNYLLAMIFSLLEYFIEIVLFPELKEQWVVSYLGLTMVVIGEIIRKMAIITAGQSFTHLIRTHHDERHELITYGIYRYVRHPSYCGFLIWSVGTQIMLCNPVSTIAFAIVVWHFFAKRIPYEEFFLKQFFGLQYEEYGQRVVSGVPFVKWRLTSSVG